VHFSAACKGMLSEFQKGGSRTLHEVVSGIRLTSHVGRERTIDQATIFARYPASALGGCVHLQSTLKEMYPNYNDMIAFAATLTKSGEYECDIELLLDPESEIEYCKE
jgi:hypothetical protein